MCKVSMCLLHGMYRETAIHIDVEDIHVYNSHISHADSIRGLYHLAMASRSRCSGALL